MFKVTGWLGQIIRGLGEVQSMNHRLQKGHWVALLSAIGVDGTVTETGSLPLVWGCGGKPLVLKSRLGGGMLG